MITKTTIINPLSVDVPILVIVKAKYRELKSKIRFDDDLKDYQENGIVVLRPDIFWMGKIIDDPKDPSQPALFVRFAFGQLDRLMATFPWGDIERICFCRREDPRLRSWSVKRMLQLAKGK